MESLLTTDDVAEWLRMDVVTVRRLVAKGDLPAYRIGGEYRFRQNELEEYLEQRRVPAPPGSLRALWRRVTDPGKLVTVARVSEAFDQFTERAKTVLTLAQEEARELHHQYIGTEHLLLGLIRESDGIAARVLQELAVDLERVRATIEQTVGHPTTSDESGAMPLTGRSKRVLELAVGEAHSLGHQYLGTEHLLLGLMREAEGLGASILRDLGIGMEDVSKRVSDALKQHPDS